MLNSYLEVCVYPKDAFNGQFDKLPAVELEDAIEDYFEVSDEVFLILKSKLEQSSRKLCMMWHAGRQALESESDFYSTTIKDAPALFGEDAINIHYHLEAMVLFARSAMDIGSTIFGWTLPDPFPKRRYDSFNKVIKEITKNTSLDLSEYINKLRENNTSWLSIIAGMERGRSLRDKLAHQTEFPIDYTELNPHSEKRYAVVRIDQNVIPLEEFIDTFCCGVIKGYLEIEKCCLANIKTVKSYSIEEDI